LFYTKRPSTLRGGGGGDLHQTIEDQSL
jgi:hypothetical protein